MAVLYIEYRNLQPSSLQGCIQPVFIAQKLKQKLSLYTMNYVNSST